MSLNTFEFVNKLLLVSANVLEINYAIETPTSLDIWTQDNKGPFIANLELEETDRTPINSSLDNVVYTASLLCNVSNDYDLTELQVREKQNDARKIMSNFVFLMKQNNICKVENKTFNRIYRNGAYTGVGVFGTVTISLPDRDDHCDLFCNTMTKNIDC